MEYRPTYEEVKTYLESYTVEEVHTIFHQLGHGGKAALRAYYWRRVHNYFARTYTRE